MRDLATVVGYVIIWHMDFFLASKSREISPKTRLSLELKQPKMLKVKKTRILGPNPIFGGFWAFWDPPPPLWKVKGSFDLFTSFLDVFSRKNHHRHGHAWMGLVSTTGKLAKLKIMKAAKKPIQKYNSYFWHSLWKFHRFASMVAGWLKPWI